MERVTMTPLWPHSKNGSLGEAWLSADRADHLIVMQCVALMCEHRVERRCRSHCGIHCSSKEGEDALVLQIHLALAVAILDSEHPAVHSHHASSHPCASTLRKNLNRVTNFVVASCGRPWICEH